MQEFASYECLGRVLADMIDQLDFQRRFAGDMEGEFRVPLEDGSEYIVTVRRAPTDVDIADTHT